MQTMCQLCKRYAGLARNMPGALGRGCAKTTQLPRSFTMGAKCSNPLERFDVGSRIGTLAVWKFDTGHGG